MSIIEFLTSHIYTFLALASTGVFAGILAGLLGVGGGNRVNYFVTGSSHYDAIRHKTH